MTMRSLLPPERSSDPADVHRHTYRIFCAIAGMLNPVFGLVYGFTDPDATDPLWARFAVAVISLLLVSFSFMNAWVRERLIGLVRGFFYLLIVYLVGLTALNDFSPNYTLGLMFAVTAVGVAFSLGLKKRMVPLRRYLAFAVLLTVPAALLAEMPLDNAAILWICAFSTALVIYVAADARIKAEESVEASEERYHTLMSAASDAIFIADPGTGMLLDANQKARELVGRSLEELRHLQVAELFPPEDRLRYRQLFEAHVFEQQAITEDLFVAHRSGDCVPVDVSASLVEVGSRKFIQGIFRRHRYEQQLVEAKERAEELLRLKTSLLNNMSHELRTPLTSILGYAEIMNEQAEGGLREHAGVIITSALRLQETLNSILGLAQLESGTASLNVRAIDAGGYVTETIPLLRPLADRKGIGFEVRILTPGALVAADEVCLNRILNNLVGNAVKFTEEGYVTVEIEADDEHVFLRVRDTGIGIGEEFQKHLFHEFRQESTGLSRSYEGNGLGLAITKKLVELMHGRIEVESEKGRGSTFTVRLPRAPAPEPGRPAGEPPRRRVLLVEDNGHARNLVTERMRRYFDVEEASDPATALDLAARLPFDAFFLDINLGAAHDGVDVMSALRAMPRYARTPIVAVTAYAMPGDREAFLDAGFDYYLGKPFSKRQLLDVVERIFPQPVRASGARNAEPAAPAR